MKAVYAYVKKSKFDDVSMALYAMPEVTGLTLCDGRGWGRAAVSEEEPQQYVGQLEENVKVEVVCQDDVAVAIAATIRKHAHTGVRGDGLVYVFTIDTVSRIATDADISDAIDD